MHSGNGQPHSENWFYSFKARIESCFTHYVPRFIRWNWKEIAFNTSTVVFAATNNLVQAFRSPTANSYGSLFQVVYGLYDLYNHRQAHKELRERIDEVPIFKLLHWDMSSRKKFLKYLAITEGVLDALSIGCTAISFWAENNENDLGAEAVRWAYPLIALLMGLSSLILTEGYGYNSLKIEEAGYKCISERRVDFYVQSREIREFLETKITRIKQYLNEREEVAEDRGVLNEVIDRLKGQIERIKEIRAASSLEDIQRCIGLVEEKLQSIINFTWEILIDSDLQASTNEFLSILLSDLQEKHSSLRGQAYDPDEQSHHPREATGTTSSINSNAPRASRERGSENDSSLSSLPFTHYLSGITEENISGPLTSNTTRSLPAAIHTRNTHNLGAKPFRRTCSASEVELTLC